MSVADRVVRSRGRLPRWTKFKYTHKYTYELTKSRCDLEKTGENQQVGKIVKAYGNSFHFSFVDELRKKTTSHDWGWERRYNQRERWRYRVVTKKIRRTDRAVEHETLTFRSSEWDRLSWCCTFQLQPRSATRVQVYSKWEAGMNQERTNAFARDYPQWMTK